MINVGTEAIILAAGYSSRFPEFKQLLKLKDKTIIEHTISNLYDVCSRIVVVCGHRAEVIKKILSGYKKVVFVINKNYPEGMFSSIIKGVRNIKSNNFFVVPSDMPMIKKETYINLLKTKGDIVIPTYKGKKGHPVLMSSKFIPELLKEKSDSNFKEFIEKKSFILVEVDDEGVLIDIDTKEDFDKIKNK
jgi:molybdenum cofactor cytidylyltransferase